MVQQELLSYIKEQLPLYPELDLRKVLADAGWQQVDVDAAFAFIAQAKAAAAAAAPMPAPAQVMEPKGTPVVNQAPRVEIPVVADTDRSTMPLTRPATASTVSPAAQAAAIGYHKPVIAPVLQTTRITPTAPVTNASPTMSVSKPAAMTRPPMMTSMIMNSAPDKVRMDEGKRTPVLQVYRPQTSSLPDEQHHNGSHTVLIVILILLLTLVGGSVYAFWAGLVPKPIVEMVQQIIPGFSASSDQELNAQEIESMVPVKFDDGDSPSAPQNVPPAPETVGTTTATTTAAAGSVTATTTATSTASKPKSATTTPQAATTTSPAKPVTATSTGTTTKAK